jgi:hypothetical protein
MVAGKTAKEIFYEKKQRIRFGDSQCSDGIGLGSGGVRLNRTLSEWILPCVRRFKR